MRILHVHSGNLYGGIETMLTALARADGETGDSAQRFALCFEGRLSNTLLAAGAQVDLLHPVRASRPHTVLRARRRITALLAARPVDVAVTHSPWIHAIAGPALRASGVPAVQWVHGALHGWAHRWARRSMPAGLICNSAFTRSLLPREYAPVKTEVIYCPLDLPTVEEAVSRAEIRRELQTPLDDVVVVQASRLEPWKGHLVHLRALASLADVKGWTLWVVGGAQRPEEADFLRELQAFARGAGLEARVRFTGEQSDVRRFLAAADIYCQPNLDPEPFGLAYVEAMAAGLPVVASDAGGVREIVDVTTGVLVQPNDPAALSRVLHDLIHDAPRRRELGAAGMRRAPVLCDPARQLRALHQFLGTVIAPASLS